MPHTMPGAILGIHVAATGLPGDHGSVLMAGFIVAILGGGQGDTHLFMIVTRTIHQQ
ncbi:MAG: hypothetical protein HWN71_07245, partial [Desulfobacterales bacterium]|nr:hypothetical protein [Desulfobacterales bacterium]